MHQFCRRDLYTFGIASVPAILDPDVAAFGPAQPLECIEERRAASLTFSIGLRPGRHKHATPSGLLRARRERPRRRPPQKGDELTPLHHSTTSSPPNSISSNPC